MAEPWFELAIIGDGAAGTLLAHALASFERPSDIVWIGRSERFGPGLAYGTEDPAHLLNVRAGQLSADPEKPSHFSRFACVPADAFAARRDYGRYLAGLVTRATRLRTDVTGLERRSDGFILQLGERHQLAARRVALALGLARPSGRLLRDVPPRFVHADPWAPLPPLAAEAPVLLLGTGLTMADVLLSLRARGHRGPVVAVSRRGLLPHAHLETPPPPWSPGPFDAVSLRARVSAIRMEIARAELSGQDWRAAFDALRPHTTWLWRQLSAADRARFLRHVRRFWDVHRHRLPPPVAARLEEEQRSGALRVVAGQLVGWRLRSGDRLDALLRLRTGQEVSEEAALLIDCTGPELDLRRVAGLPRQLLRAGLAAPSDSGLGLAATGQGELRDSTGAPVRGLFALGALLAGELWETTAIPEIRAQAWGLARRLDDEARERKAPELQP
jgi:uncharacterized NAD(P)/FAD-binding protein YdhS